jgi:ATP-dependent Clp protease ATP-binding subunit ClpA
MYERFTDRARKVMQLANQEAQRFNHEYIGTEHILLGLVKEGSGVAANVLKNLDIDLRKIRLEVERIVQAGPDMLTTAQLPQTPRARKVIEYGTEEAFDLNHNYVGTEHLLLGLLCEHEGVAGQILMKLGLNLEDVRQEVFDTLAGGSAPRAAMRRSPNAEVQNLHASDPRVRDLPAKVRQAFEEVESQTGQLNEEMRAAVAEQEFERTAHFRDRADKLKTRIHTINREWHTWYTIDPAWLSWNGGTIPKIARVIRQERRWQDLPVLADALEEAGCTDQEILGHCRQAGQHGRGCWVLELLLRQFVVGTQRIRF